MQLAAASIISGETICTTRCAADFLIDFDHSFARSLIMSSGRFAIDVAEMRLVRPARAHRLCLNPASRMRVCASRNV